MAVEKQDDVQLEFKSADDAWYDVSVTLNGSELLVHYLGFPPEDDDRFTPEDFKSVDDLRARLRFSSQQLQDENCGFLKKGMKICASFASKNEDNRFYNAVVKRVLRSKHHYKGGEEVCKCNFEVVWEDGPCINTKTSVTCENICLPTSGDIENNLTIKTFMKLLDKNTIKKKAANVKAKYKDGQREAVKTESNFVSINGHEGSYIISGLERLENLSDSFKKNVGPGNTIETVFSGINEVAASSPHMPPMSTQSCKLEELTNDRLNAVDNDAIDSEISLQDDVSNSEVMCSQANMSRSLQTKNREEVLKTTIEAPLSPIGKSVNEVLHTEAILIEQEETQLDSLHKERERRKASMDLNSNVELEHEQLEIPSHSDTSLMKQEEACVDLVSKKQKLSLDLHTKNELEQEKLDIPTNRVGFHGNSKNGNGMDNGVFGISKIVGSLNNQGPFHSGWLESDESDDCGTPQIGKGGFNAIIKEIASNSACLTADVRIKGTGLSDDNEVSACTGIKRPSSYDFEKLDEQVIVGENRNDEEKREKKEVLASCWGKGKRQKHISNELFTGEIVNTAKKLIQDGNDFDGVATLSSSFLTPYLKNSTSHFTTETLIFTAGMEKVDAVKDVINLANVNKQEKSLPVEENNHDTIRKKCDNEILDLNKQPDNHVQLEGGLSTSGEMKAGCTYRVNFEGQKNLPSIQRDVNSHHASEKSNCCSCEYSDATNMPSCDSDQDLERCQSHLKYESHTSECCCDLHSCRTNVSSEDESFDIEVNSCNCCGKYLKPNILSNRTGTRIHKGPQEARCGCSGARLGYCGEDIGAEDRFFNCSEILVLDNLEKDVTPSDVKKVMACVTCAVHVYIFPSLKFEQFTRAFVWFRDHSSLMKALAILQNDDFFTISSKGRPWVALLLHTDNEVCKGIIGGYDIEPEDCQHCCSNMLPRKILRANKGTDEYERAKKMKNLFLEFKEHLAILHKRLELEECSVG